MTTREKRVKVSDLNHERATIKYVEFARLKGEGHTTREIARLWGISDARAYDYQRRARLYGYLEG